MLHAWGGADPVFNPRLRDALRKARQASMSNDKIQQLLKRSQGDSSSDNYVSITYEGYGPGGVAVMVDCLTDNRNRTVGEVRHAFSKCGGNLGTDGSVAYLFTKKGVMAFEAGNNKDLIAEIAIEAGADDIEVNDDDSIEVITTPEQFENVRQAFIDKNLEPAEANITMVAATQVPITDAEDAQKMLRLLDMLEDLDDVQDVYSNADIADEFLME